MLNNKPLMAIVIIAIIAVFFVISESGSSVPDKTKYQTGIYEQAEIDYTTLHIENTYLGTLNSVHTKLKIYNAKDFYFDYDIIQNNETVLSQKKGKIDTEKNIIYFNTLPEGTDKEIKLINILAEANVNLNTIKLLVFTNEKYKFTQIKD